MIKGLLAINLTSASLFSDSKSSFEMYLCHRRHSKQFWWQWRCHQEPLQGHLKLTRPGIQKEVEVLEKGEHDQESAGLVTRQGWCPQMNRQVASKPHLFGLSVVRVSCALGDGLGVVERPGSLVVCALVLIWTVDSVSDDLQTP